MFKTIPAYFFAVALLYLAGGCSTPTDNPAENPAENPSQLSPDDSTSPLQPIHEPTIEDPSTEPPPQGDLFTIFEFEGYADPITGTFSINKLEPEESSGLTRQALSTGDWGICLPQEASDGIPYSGPVNTIEIVSVAESFKRDEECGDNPLYAVNGAYCATVDVTWFGTELIPDIYAEITFLTPPSGHAGLDDAPAPGMNNGPNDGLGLFFYGPIDAQETSRIRWVFERFDDAAFYFRGRLVSVAREICGDGVDNNCNNLSEEGCGFCGDGIQAFLEQCDDGNMLDGDGCDYDCTVPNCGDGILDLDEECDDGNNDPTDGCAPGCKHETCGNGILDLGEECDDGDDAQDLPVNTYTTGSQQNLALDNLADQSTVLVWDGEGDTDSEGIWVRFIQPDGTPQTDPFAANTETANTQSNADITALEDGNIMVVWQSQDQDGAGLGIYGQLFDQTTPVGSEILINQTTDNDQTNPAIDKQ